VTSAPAAGAYGRAERIGRAVETALLGIALSVLIGLAALQIIMRDGFNSGFGWVDEVLRILVLWVGMLGAVVASREHRHLAVDVVSHYLSVRSRRRVLIAVDAFTTAICFMLAWVSGDFVAMSAQSRELLVEVIPAWLIQSILPLGFFLIGYRYAVWTVHRIRDDVHGGEDPGRLEVPRSQ
jgi:TRAP-type C4-dicarboxylate transport system permease small subunit